ncbi:carboxypeptidase regulatory-like domain-containing protein [Halosolutus gelatinilyticus]|uniref:carboxypeptidase regulatory-like domain-containing protein n=1 Tax=Halosolutus gelatinilyticus TaxID=2931975 RepID=UPI001FF20A45|nr:carboxypeptidase regulatory-like domain-containing protein [Halosolutus gelatinilyticus]
MRRSATEQRSKTRSIQTSVQILLTISGVVFLVAGLTLAAGVVSVGGTLGPITDHWGGSDSGDGAGSGNDDGADTTGDDSGDDGADGSGGDNSDGTGQNGGDGTADDGDGNGTGGDGNETDAGTGGGGNETDDGTSGDGEDGSNNANESDGNETHALTVFVEDDDGNPIEGAAVEVDSQSGSTNNEETGPRGEAAFDLEDGEYAINASADGYEAANATTEIDGANETVTLTLSATDDGGDDGDDNDAGNGASPSTLTVLVEGDNGEPIKNATVEVKEDARFFPSSEEKDVDNDGKAEFKLEDGKYTVTASADGYEETVKSVEVDGDDEVILLTLDQN